MERSSLDKDIDARTLDDLEATLIAADLGSVTTNEVLAAMREKVERRLIGDTGELKRLLQQDLLTILRRADESRPKVVADPPEVSVFHITLVHLCFTEWVG